MHDPLAEAAWDASHLLQRARQLQCDVAGLPAGHTPPKATALLSSLLPLLQELAEVLGDHRLVLSNLHPALEQLGMP